VSVPLRGPAARHQAATPASAKQVAYLRSLLQQVGVIDPATDPSWPATASRILGRDHDGSLDHLTKPDATALLDACRQFVDADNANITRLPTAFIDPADDPWASAPTPPTVIRYQGHTYQRIDT
jgi:hypothetical protein